jgi:ribosomal small subunit protein bTHX
MGRGDKKTKKGKRFASSYGRVRVRKEKTEKYFVKPKVKKEEEVVETKAAPKKKTTAKKTTIKKEID